jgi:hypothetical protein
MIAKDLSVVRRDEVRRVDAMCSSRSEEIQMIVVTVADQDEISSHSE